ncbi:S66 peptidase family protein [Dactylosporangium sp. CA-139066]|uniref:S66 peptidase family protein n=1 Tax=Dactylosporangium sp. CA-139066 TaxID=3239930 RepID=UPI003D8C5562
MTTVRPLEPGDVVRLVSPSGPAAPERVARGVELLESWGLRAEPAPHVLDRRGYFGGTDDARLDDLNAALADPRVRAVICTRGGYGAQRIVERVRFGEPKPIVGFSDITALQLAAWRHGRWPAVHGPGGAWLDARTPASSAQSLRRALMTDGPLTVRGTPGPGSGRASGVLLGGNLAMLVSTLGTVDMPDLAGAVVLLEDVGEAPYRIDRMLTQLLRAGALAGVRGIALGQFTECEGTGSVADVLAERLGGLGVPVLAGLPIGHGEGQETVVVGAPAVLDADAGTLVSRA